MSNQFITFSDLCRELQQLWSQALFNLPTEMFIAGQYNWERPEFDDHG